MHSAQVSGHRERDRLLWRTKRYDRLWPILLKNSIRGFLRANLGVSNHHLIKLRGTESVLEGRLSRGLSMQPLQGSFSTE
jgi:hypothetical protein